MFDYECDASFPHFKSTILSHAYWRFVEKVGHNVAGHVLHGMPAKLPARPRFIDAMRAFKDVALERYGQATSQHAVDVFKNEVGIGLQEPPGC